MRILFLDDSYQKASGLLGYGGFCVEPHRIRALGQDVDELKRLAGIPPDVELKWSLPRDHFLRTEFAGNRQELYSRALDLLPSHGATALVALHYLKECYVFRDHGWSLERTAKWAIRQQLRFLAERFQNNCLHRSDDVGLIVCDEFGNRIDEDEVLQGFASDLLTGTQFADLAKIAMRPITAQSHHSSHVQIADLIVGIVTGAAGGNGYALELFPKIARLLCIRHSIRPYAGLFSSAVLGYGLKVFPTECQDRVAPILRELDDRLVATERGILERLAS